MRPETRLESAVFQLTPTRTRCDLVLIANERTEKIASGLLNPFLAHLKSAQDQIAKGGYSIKLEPHSEADAIWFTKGTLERFVRFVSTPEILERVTTIESEILQIDDAIAVQSSDTPGPRTVDDPQGKQAESSEVSVKKTSYDAEEEKAIIIYKPVSGSQPLPEATDDTMPEENSKVQLMRVLETRKAVLRKEQAMAFARATAAGFDMDNMMFLISFANCFGASRLMKACSQFMDLWKRKHETGQWIEVEPESMSMRSDFPPYNASGILFAGDSMPQNADAMSVSNGHTNTESTDPKISSNDQHPGHHGYFPAAYPLWAMHPPPGAPMYQPYPTQGMPYYPNYPGAAPPYYPPPYPPMDDPRYHSSGRKPRRRHSRDSKDNADSETYDEGNDHSASEPEKDSHRRRSHRKDERSGKKKSGVVVIRNLNYVASNKHGSTESESETASDDVSEEDGGKSHSKSQRKHQNSLESSKKKDSRRDAVVSPDACSRDGVTYEQEADQGNWQAFQSLLLKAEEKTKMDDADMLSAERESVAKRKENQADADLTVLPDWDSRNIDDRFAVGIESNSGRPRVKHIVLNDEMLISGVRRGAEESYLKEVEGGSRVYRGASSDDFMVHGRENPMIAGGSLDPLAGNEYEHAPNLEKKVYTVTDDSFMIPVRSGSHDDIVTEDRATIDIGIEFPSTVQREAESSSRLPTQPSYEPDELEMMPERGIEVSSFGYDPAMEFETEIMNEKIKQKEPVEAEDVPAATHEEPKENIKDKKPKNAQSGLDKRKKDAFVRRLSSSTRTAPLNDAQKRADALRTYKADLQKLKKEQEEEQLKRLERLKEERQRRIAARSGSSVGAQVPATPQQSKAKPASKASPSSLKNATFNDTQTGSSSPMKKLAERTTSAGSDPSKSTRTSRLYGTANAVSKSVSSLPETKKDYNGTLKSAPDSSRTKPSDSKGNRSESSSKPRAAHSEHARKEHVLPDDSETKKISAILQLDQSKTAALPELRVKSEVSALSAKMNSAANDTAQEDFQSKVTPVSLGNKSRADECADIANDDTVVVEKTVVMLENEMVSPAPVILEAAAISNKAYVDRKGKSFMESEYPAPRALPSSVVVDETKNARIPIPDYHTNSFEVVIDRLPGDASAEKPYQAPYARLTSMDSATKVPSDTEPPSNFDSEVHARVEGIRAPLTDAPEMMSLDHTLEASEKSRGKEVKGFRKLLKFGRKSHASNSADGSMDSDASSVDEGTVATIAADDVVKNNLNDSQSGSYAPKASRHFSILSPFRSKNSDKKVLA